MQFTYRNSLKGEITHLSCQQALPRALVNYWITLANTGVSEVCELLRPFGIMYVLYVKRFNDGSQIELTNNIAWSEHYYTHAYYKMCPFRNTKECYDSGTFLWSGFPYQGTCQKFREYFKLDHGITFVLRHVDCNEFFNFAGNSSNYGLINFYLNQQCILKRFILYFKDKLSSLIKTAERKRILLPVLDGDISKEESRPFKGIMSELLKVMPIKRYYIDGIDSETYLTHREAECLKWHIHGKTACEISMILNISKRTVEVHLENIKRKIDCVKQSQLGYKFARLMDLL